LSYSNLDLNICFGFFDFQSLSQNSPTWYTVIVVFFFKSLNLESLDFCLCIEIPIKAKRMNASYLEIPSYERKRITGFKKVSEFRDGFKILFGMLRYFSKIR